MTAPRPARRVTTAQIVVCGMMIALDVILGSPFLSLTLSFGSLVALNAGLMIVPALVAGLMFGPAYGGFVHLAADVLRAFLFPKGPYDPRFSLSAFLLAFTPVLIWNWVERFFHGKWRFAGFFLCVLLSQALFSLGLNTFWLYTLEGAAVVAKIPVRAANLLMSVFHATLAMMLFGIGQRAMGRRGTGGKS